MRRLISAVACICAIAAVGTSAAQANSQYFFNGYLGAGQKASGTPHGTDYFVASYQSGALACVALQPGENSNVVKYEVCGTGSGVSTSFPAQFGRGNLLNSSASTFHFLAEERW